MVDADKDWFCEQVKAFGVIVGKPFLVEQKIVYWRALKHMSRPDFERAATALMKTWKWPRIPYPSDFIAAEKTGWL